MRLCRNNGSRSAFRYLCSTAGFVMRRWHPKSIGGNLQLEAAPPLYFEISSVRERATTATPGIWTPKTADGAAPGFGQADLSKKWNTEGRLRTTTVVSVEPLGSYAESTKAAVSRSPNDEEAQHG
eukprot:1853603-Pleurochrysis_carterae.AAC.4